MLFRAKFISARNTLVKRTVDTDILVITLCNKPKLFQRLKARLEVELTSNNILRYLNVNEINQSLGYRLCCALPGSHAFTDCDFTAYCLVVKGKLIPWRSWGQMPSSSKDNQRNQLHLRYMEQCYNSKPYKSST